MRTTIDRDAAWALLRQYNREPFHLQHALTVEGVMRWYAQGAGLRRGDGLLGRCGVAPRH